MERYPDSQMNSLYRAGLKTSPVTCVTGLAGMTQRSVCRVVWAPPALADVHRSHAAIGIRRIPVTAIGIRPMIVCLDRDAIRWVGGALPGPHRLDRAGQRVHADIGHRRDREIIHGLNDNRAWRGTRRPLGLLIGGALPASLLLLATIAHKLAPQRIGLLQRQRLTSEQPDVSSQHEQARCGLEPLAGAAAFLAGGIGCFVLGVLVTLTEMPALVI